uniref:Uncharacterized protein n=1 Tax=Lepeophtheirus salmonis TaxID=72036 RepID=A0A0K2V2H7_LEPSM
MLPVNYTVHCKYTRYGFLQETDEATITTYHGWCTICCTRQNISKWDFFLFEKIINDIKYSLSFSVCYKLSSK